MGVWRVNGVVQTRDMGVRCTVPRSSKSNPDYTKLPVACESTYLVRRLRRSRP